MLSIGTIVLTVEDIARAGDFWRGALGYVSRSEPSDEIHELCARLDNLPLAVELAAARTTALTPGQILERLSQRLDLLKGGRDAECRARRPAGRGAGAP